MEHSKERNYVCKFCTKTFPCGKSLGGHIRTHMNKSSVDSDEDDDANRLKISDNGGQSSYGLREAPKKNKRFADQTDLIASKQQQQQQQLLLCKECNKKFSSMKALCGHMASHSDREKMVMDSESDTETSSVSVRRRSKKAMKHHNDFVVDSINQSSSSSLASEIDQEQEELALCLMMLSRDLSFKRVHHLMNSVAESSDNNSVILETKSCSGELKVFNGNRFLDAKKLQNDQNLNSAEKNGVLFDDSDNSDSGYFRNGPKKVNSEASVDGFLRSTESNKTVMGTGHESVKVFKEGKSNRSSRKYDPSKSTKVQKKIRKTNKCNESVYESGENSMETDPYSDRRIDRSSSSRFQKAEAAYKKANAKKKSKGHECPICFRVFKSGQALGGHKRSHFMGSHENSSTTVVIKQDMTKIHSLIDLNLPAPVDD